jgi:hypothetical protein
VDVGSFLCYARGERGTVVVNEQRRAELKKGMRPIFGEEDGSNASVEYSPFENREGWGSLSKGTFEGWASPPRPD